MATPESQQARYYQMTCCGMWWAERGTGQIQPLGIAVSIQTSNIQRMSCEQFALIYQLPAVLTCLNQTRLVHQTKI